MLQVSFHWNKSENKAKTSIFRPMKSSGGEGKVDTSGAVYGSKKEDSAWFGGHDEITGASKIGTLWLVSVNRHNIYKKQREKNFLKKKENKDLDRANTRWKAWFKKKKKESIPWGRSKNLSTSSTESGILGDANTAYSIRLCLGNC